MNGRNSGIGSLRTWWQSRALQSEDADARARAVHRLAAVGNERAVSVLVETLDDPDSAIRAKTAHALGAIGNLDAIEPIVSRLRREDDNQVVSALVDALKELDPKLAIPHLLAALVEPDLRGRHNVAAAARKVCWDLLDDIGRARVAIVQNAWKEVASLGAAAVQPLAQALRTDNYRARREAADVLGRITSFAALETLKTLLTDPTADHGARELAAWSLRKYYDAHLDDACRAQIAIVEGDWARAVALGQAAIDPLMETLADPDLDMRQHAAEALTAIGGPQAAAALGETLQNHHEGVEVREYAARALGSMPDSNPHSLGLLAGALRDEAWKVRQAAADALVELGWVPGNNTEKALLFVARELWEQAVFVGEAAVEPLVDALKYRAVSPAAARALLSVGQLGLEALLGVLRDPGEAIGIREVIARTLAEIGDPRAVEPVLSMLEDQDMVVRQAAVWTLEKLGWEPADDTQRALAAIAHEEWDKLGGIGPAAVEPLLAMANAGLAPRETAGALQQVLEVSAERLSVEELQALSVVEDIHAGHDLRSAELVANDSSPAHSVRCERVRELARFELMKRGIIAGD